MKKKSISKYYNKKIDDGTSDDDDESDDDDDVSGTKYEYDKHNNDSLMYNEIKKKGENFGTDDNLTNFLQINNITQNKWNELCSFRQYLGNINVTLEYHHEIRRILKEMCPPQHFSYSTYATKCKLIDCNKSPCYVQIQKNGNRQEHCNCFWTRSGTYCQRLSSSVIILFVLSIVVIISVLAFSAFFTYRRSKKRRREIDRIVTSPYRIKKSLQMKNSLNGKKEESRKETEKNLKSSTSLISIVSEYMNEVNMEERLKKKSKKERTNIHQLYLPPRKTLPAIFMRDDGMTHSYHDIESI